MTIAATGLATVRGGCTTDARDYAAVMRAMAARGFAPGLRPFAFLFAPGAGAPSSSDWMQAFAQRLRELGRVVTFDYPYQIEGRRSPDRLETLLAAHRSAFERLSAEHVGPLVLIGKSMGSRIGCHLANTLDNGEPAALICLGYPLLAPKGAVRDSVLLELKRPILLVQGSRDALCPLDRLGSVRAQMSAPNELLVVQGGDHSLRVAARTLASQGRTQADVDSEILGAIQNFLLGSEGP